MQKALLVIACLQSHCHSRRVNGLRGAIASPDNSTVVFAGSPPQTADDNDIRSLRPFAAMLLGLAPSIGRTQFPARTLRPRFNKMLQRQGPPITNPDLAEAEATTEARTKAVRMSLRKEDKNTPIYDTFAFKIAHNDWDESSLLLSLENLTDHLVFLGAIKDAEVLRRLQLEIAQKTDEPHHHIVHYLAFLLRRLGRLEEAEEMQLQAIELRNRTFGPHHPNTLASNRGLAMVYRMQNNWDRVEDIYSDIVSVVDDTSSRGTVMKTKLAAAKQRLGDLEGSEELTRQVVSACEERFGTNSTQVIGRKKNLIYTLLVQGKYKEAEETLSEIYSFRADVAMAAYEQHLEDPENGAKHELWERMRTARNDLKREWRRLEMLLESLRSLNEAIEDEKTASEEDKESIRSDMLYFSEQFADLMYWYNAYEKSELQTKQILRLRRLYGMEDDSWILKSARRLAQIAYSQGDTKKGEILQRKVVKESIAKLGLGDKQTLTYMWDLVGMMKIRGEMDQSAKLLKQLVTATALIWGSDDLNTVAAKRSLAFVLQALGQIELAEKYFSDVVKTLDATRRAYHWRTNDAKREQEWTFKRSYDYLDLAKELHKRLPESGVDIKDFIERHKVGETESVWLQHLFGTGESNKVEEMQMSQAQA